MKLSQIQPNLWGHPSRVFGVQFWLSQAVGLAGGPEAGAGREAGQEQPRELRSCRQRDGGTCGQESHPKVQKLLPVLFHVMKYPCQTINPL